MTQLDPLFPLPVPSKLVGMLVVISVSSTGRGSKSEEGVHCKGGEGKGGEDVNESKTKIAEVT
ncbi:hypothetical protein A0H81_05282 [Grifola frondosa]|uniref:Uncharacterized protein n=1 Tax=Grifola frondosa TaxID=5627 RepID=A0A1C7ME07_GRIFR|nr:hypothetical protein A0H81_05282 [Grifola frondosa]